METVFSDDDDDSIYDEGSLSGDSDQENISPNQVLS
jgi:hypothetical protein